MVIPILEMWELRLRKISGRNEPGHCQCLGMTRTLQRRNLRLRETQSPKQAPGVEPFDEVECCGRKARTPGHAALKGPPHGWCEIKDSETCSQGARTAQKYHKKNSLGWWIKPAQGPGTNPSTVPSNSLCDPGQVPSLLWPQFPCLWIKGVGLWLWRAAEPTWGWLRPECLRLFSQEMRPMSHSW